MTLCGVTWEVWRDWLKISDPLNGERKWGSGLSIVGEALLDESNKGCERDYMIM